MNRPRLKCRKFVHEFSDGNRAVAKFRKNGLEAAIKWARPMTAGILFEYLQWRDTTLAKISPPGCFWEDS
ncbi:MAG: hypothetical protein EBT03_07975 [Betaproteobacteria bacterium]|nr:hypothetical protein [Betaproteobacteria bacterium]